MKNKKAKSDSNKYLNEPLSYDILGLRVTPKPLKLRWKLLTANLSFRLKDYCRKESGLTDEEFKDPDYASFISIYENSFFSFHYEPKEAPTGRENLVELLSMCAVENINWKKFIDDKLKGKPEAKQIEIYSVIRKAGLSFYNDFFLEIAKIRAA